MEGAAARIGTLVGGKYRIDGLLGEGGMGVVYRAFDVRLERPVALKLVRTEIVAASPELLGRFEREARAAARLSSHPNIVTIYEDGVTSDGVPFMAQELLSGSSLAAILHAEGSLAPSRARELLVPAMEAVAFAHQHGIVHRDLKPENLFLHTDARGTRVPKVLDFGIARVEGSKGPTQTGQALGTVRYMSPEQLTGRNVGAWCDVWAMGVVWFECLTGQFPFEITGDDTTYAVVAKILVDPPRPIQTVRPDVPVALAAVIDRALAREVERRYQDMSAMMAALTDAFGGQAATARTAVAMPMAPPQPQSYAPMPTSPLPYAPMPSSQPPYAPQQVSQPIGITAQPERRSRRFGPIVVVLGIGALILGPIIGAGVFFVAVVATEDLGDWDPAPMPPVSAAAPPPMAPPPFAPSAPLAPSIPVAASLPLEGSAPEPAPEVEATPPSRAHTAWEWPRGEERIWTGRWSDAAYRYRFVLTLVRGASGVEGRYEWTRTDVVGETGVEWVRGSYDDDSRTLLINGYRVSGDVGQDQYRGHVGPDGDLTGTSRTSEGDWSARFTAHAH